MEYTFTMFGVPYLHWTDENGNVFEAVKEQVEFFGKDFFESIPDDPTMTDEQLPASKKDYDYVDAWYEENPNKSAVPFPDWI